MNEYAAEVERINGSVSEQNALIQQIKTALNGKAAGGGGLPTQEKSVEIIENGIVEVLPDDGYALSKVTVDVNVEESGGEVSVEARTGTVSSDYKEGLTVHYTDDTFTLRSELVPVVSPFVSNEPLSITVAANTIVFFTGDTNLAIGGSEIALYEYGNGALPTANNFSVNIL